MTEQELIDSGELELYVCGALDPAREREISTLIKSAPRVKEEVLAIEHAYTQLAAGLAPEGNEAIYDRLLEVINKEKATARKSPVLSYLGWAAAVVFIVSTAYLFNQNTAVKADLNKIVSQKEVTVKQLELETKQKESYVATLDALSDPNTIKVTLAGQGKFENTSAVAFYNAQTATTYFNLAGLPKAPDDMVYQLWSLKLDPLTPTSLGITENTGDSASLFAVANENTSEAFGITLEPAGGSASPNLELLYTLGVVKI